MDTSTPTTDRPDDVNRHSVASGIAFILSHVVMSMHGYIPGDAPIASWSLIALWLVTFSAALILALLAFVSAKRRGRWIAIAVVVLALVEVPVIFTFSAD